MAVVGGADEVFDGAVCVSRKHSEHPGPQIGRGVLLCWRVLRLPWCAARLSPGACRVGFDVRTVGVNGDLAARETEVWGL